MIEQQPQIRIVLAFGPSLLRDLVGDILSNEVDMHVVADCSRHETSPELIQELKANVVVSGIDGTNDRDQRRRLLERIPRLTIVRLPSDAELGCLEQMRPKLWRVSLLERDLPTVIRIAVGAARGPEGPLDDLDALAHRTH